MEYMSGISEKGWCAGWLIGLEYALWTMVIKGPAGYGRYDVTREDILNLQRLSGVCGGWIVFDVKMGETFVPMDVWKELYKKHGHGS